MAHCLFFLTTTAVSAVTYSLPAALGTSGVFSNCNSATYVCTSNIDFGNDNSVVLNVTTPMTLRLTNGNFSAKNGLQINSNGNAFTIQIDNGNFSVDNNLSGAFDLVVSKGNVEIKNNGSITGNVTAGGNIKLGSNTIVYGNCNPAPTGGGTCTTTGAPRTLSIGNASVAEGNSGTTVLSFTVALSASSGSVITVSYATSNATATIADNDYVAASGTLTFSAGQTSKTISVTINGDTRSELDETITVTLSSPTNASLGAAVATGTILDDDPLADWRMDEFAWNGSANEVLDSSGNNYHGRARIAAGSTALPTTASVSRAYTIGSQSTCNYGQFDSSSGTVRRYTYVELSALPTLPSGFTFTAWIRSTNASAQHQRILVRDDAGNGWGLSLADGTGQPKLRFFNRNIANSGSVSGQGSNPSCGVFCLDTNAVLSSNNWHFVAAAIDTLGKTITLYVFDAAGGLLARTTSAFSGTWKDGTGTAAIGGETSASSEGRQTSHHFLGNIDEVRIYRGSLTQSAIQALLPRVRSCAGELHHIELQHATGTGLTCAASSVTVKACADDASPCSPYTNGVSGTLTSTGVAVNWDGATGGGVGASFVIPSGAATINKGFQPATAGSLVLATTSLSPAASNATTCNFGSPSCTFTAASAGFIFAASTTGNIATFPTQTAGIASAMHYLRAVQSSSANAAVCTPAIISQSNVPVSIAYTCNDPAFCQSGNLLTVNATTVPETGGAVNLDFDANGSAPVTLNYDDVGRITVAASKSFTPVSGGATITLSGSSNAFVVKPDHFDLSAIQCADGTANPSALNANGNKFCRAGESFGVTVTARSKSNKATRNYGQEVSPESVRLVSSLVSGLGLTAIPAVSGNFGPFNNGVASGSAFNWPEVGIITLTPGVGDSNYLGAGDVLGPASANVGRFVPHHLDTELTPFCGGFTYSGQAFPVKVTARNAAGVATKNYEGSFAKSGVYSDANSAVGTFSPPNVASGNYAAGVADLMAAPAVMFTFANKLTVPSTLKLRVTDSDAVSSAAGLTEGTTSIRSGRLWLGNAYGSDQRDLAMPLEVQSWNGTVFVKNTADNCTTLTAANVALGNKQGGLGGYAEPVSVSPIIAGAGSIRLPKPSSQAAGSVDLVVTLGSSGVPANCNSLTGGTSATSSHLSGKWCGSNYDRDPVAKATFGIFGSSNKKGPVYIRESY